MSTTASPTIQVNDLAAGTWDIDASHSEVGFQVRHLMVSKVKGSFERFSGALVVAENPLESSVSADIELASVNTRDESRHNHLRSADFFDVTTNPLMSYRSTGLEQHGSDYVVHGELSIKGVTRPVDLALEFNGVSGDPWGGTRAGFSAVAEISRKDFGIDFDVPMDGPGVVVGDKIKVLLEIEAVRRADS